MDAAVKGSSVQIPAPSTEREARIDLAAAHRLAVRDGLNEGTWNHFSSAVPGDSSSVLLSPAHMHWSQVRASDLTITGADSSAIEARGGPTWIAYCMHYPIHEARPDAACVLHVHPPFATAISMLKDGRLRMAEQNAILFWDRIAYSDYYDGAGPSGLSMGRGMAEALGDNDVLFLKSHGVIVVGATIAAAYRDLYLLERACRVQILGLATGQELDLIPEEVCRKFGGEEKELSDETSRQFFGAMKRVLNKEQGDYVD